MKNYIGRDCTSKNQANDAQPITCPPMATWSIVWLIRTCVILSLGSGQNTALNKPTWMSSTRRVQYAHTAVDGETDAYNESLTIHTKLNEPSAWWKVDLETEVQSPLIILYFRSDYKARRNGIQFYTSVTNPVTPKDGNLCYTVRGRSDGRDIPDILNVTCDETLRYLTLYTETANDHSGPVLDFAEVQVWNTYESYSPFTGDDVDDTYTQFANIKALVTGNGRNVALHKETSMSSTRRVQYSRRAVDGVTDGNDESMTIHTKEDKPNAWWKVDLEMEVHSPLVRLFFRYDYMKRRKGIQFYTSQTDSPDPKEGDLCYTVTGRADGRDIPDVLYANCSGAWRYLTVYTETNNDGGGAVLDFAEVEVWILPGCATGQRYGPNCRKSCIARHCKMVSSCDVTQGACDGGCKAGWRGTDCTQVCPGGVYGVDCSNACGRCGNNSSCHHVTGICPEGCETGWQLDLCKEACPKGKYGVNCLSACGHCNGTCDLVEGRCLHGCSNGYIGPRCLRAIACPKGKYGVNCLSACGHCNGTCDVVDGRCLHGCSNGYIGPRCLRTIETKNILPNKATQSFTNITGLGVLLGGLVGMVLTLLLAVGVYLCVRCRKSGLHLNRRSTEEEKSKDTHESHTINKRIETRV
ncbi:uncharacterized protein [Haliotis cracherodii]|uniref:uncharacterized protein isoform X3 n=1 Tax=Haliotis cracherodii TaxID=6455 RepID=UPI0039E8A256